MRKLAYILKTSKIFYIFYFYIVSGLLRLWGIFIKTDEKLILFNSYGGKKIDDSPKVIFDVMRLDKRFTEYRLIWALQEPEKWRKNQNIEIVKCDTLSYFYYALKAKVWITNSSMERGLNFKKKNTICFNTWHGTPIKKMGIDIREDNQSFRGKANVKADIMLAQSQYDIDIFSHAFELPQERFCCTGLPRNDFLVHYTKEDVEKIKKKLEIPKEKKVLLYAPTFREFTKGQNREVVLNIPIDMRYWQKTLADKYVILFRAHYEVARHMDVSTYSLFMDVSGHPDLNELMIVSDGLISDYSSIYFDYSIMHKPMYCFAYDYVTYMENRGMYLDLQKELPCEMHQSEKELMQDILSTESNMFDKCNKVKAFQERFVTVYGSGAKKACDVLFKKL